MKRLIMLFFLPVSMLFVSSCEWKEQAPEGPGPFICGVTEPELKEGDYTGFFCRTGPDGNSIRANITLSLIGGKFSGTSHLNKYPAICEGTYTLKGDSVEFDNGCVWTADFDWSLILDGTFMIGGLGEEIVLSKAVNEGYTDIYHLKKR